MFPEGTRSENGDIGEFRKGAVLIALKNGVPYIPIAIVGANKALPKGTNVFKSKKAKISIKIGNPVFIDPTIPITVENLDILKEDMKRRIEDLYNGKNEYTKEMQKIIKTEDNWIGLYEPIKIKSYEEYELSIG